MARGAVFIFLAIVIGGVFSEYYDAAAEVEKAKKLLAAEKEHLARSANPGREKGSFKKLTQMFNRTSEGRKPNRQPGDSLNKIFQIHREEVASNDQHGMMNDNEGAIAINQKTIAYDNETDSLKRKMIDLRPAVPAYEAINNHPLIPQVRGVFCDFENTSMSSSVDETCLWGWNSTVSSHGYGFRVVTPGDVAKMNGTRGYKLSGPNTDADYKEKGHFLYLPIDPSTEHMVMIQSPPFAGLWEFCKFEVMLHQYKMQNASIRLISEYIATGFQLVLMEVAGNNLDVWHVLSFTIGKVQQHVRINIEISKPAAIATDQPLPYIAIDNIKLVDCLHDPPKPSTGKCEHGQMKCRIVNTVSCIKLQQVCDLVKDCDDGSDENQNCDKMPYGSYCNFEKDECGFKNVPQPILKWVRHSGPTPTDKTGPNYDHTCGNPSLHHTPTMIPLLTPEHFNNTGYSQCVGYYFYVNMNVTGPNKERADFASTAVMRTVTFNPPPKVHGNMTSKYYNSCMIRFYYQQNGRNYGSLSVDLVEITGRGNTTIPLWFSTKDKGEHWYRAAIFLPNITRRYYLVFKTRMGMRIYSDSAIDDFSMAPECFGLNIPQSELGDYNYYEPQFAENTTVHYGFSNKPVYRFTPCGAVGRYGPVQEQCDMAYNSTPVSVSVLDSVPFKGVQVWEVPEEGIYTIIATGAGGGYGSAWAGASRGATIRAVAEFHRGELLYIMVGQRGQHACKKTLSAQESGECSRAGRNNDTLQFTSKTHEVYNTTVQDGGGGGGGGTFVFLMDKSNRPYPLVAAGGGGGISVGVFRDDGSQHGRSLVSAHPDSGHMYGPTASGAGGGWSGAVAGATVAGSGAGVPAGERAGAAAVAGGRGGVACSGAAAGGYGGGGGGCVRGGAGGGWIGGNTNEGEHGGGGYSYVDSVRTDGAFTAILPHSHNTDGEVLIIPAVHDCGCQYRCLAMNEYRSEVKCYCPSTWKTLNETMCVLEPGWGGWGGWGGATRLLLPLAGAAALALAVLMLCACLFLYNRLQRKKEADLRQKQLLEQEVQLHRLRNPPGGNDNALAAFNPHYGADGFMTGVDFRALPQVPRESLKLVKALGQGAFGEVYQGLYRHRTADNDMPVAVKTLPELSTGQAESDFLMEAAIMAKFNHPNIVHLIGVCFDRHPRFIVLELLAGGDLKIFLRESRPRPGRAGWAGGQGAGPGAGAGGEVPAPALGMKDLLHAALDVCKGCRYLEAKRFIHRDIAARNCLLTSRGPGRVVKIADFGMARDIYRADYYKKGGKAMLPIKWMPPEAYIDGLFTTKTDVWSFGVLLWEVLSLGVMPYTGCSNREVMELVSGGGRLERPHGCPVEIYRVMCECWNPTPDDRPTFSHLFDKLIVFSQDPEIVSAPLPMVRSLMPSSEDASSTNGTQRASPCDYLVPMTPRDAPPAHSSTDQLIAHSTSQTATPAHHPDGSQYLPPQKASLGYGNIPGGVASRDGGEPAPCSVPELRTTSTFLQSNSTDRLLSSADDQSVEGSDDEEHPRVWETSFTETPETHEPGPIVDKLISITPTSPKPPNNVLTMAIEAHVIDRTNHKSNLKLEQKSAPLASPDPPRIKPWAEAPKLPAKPKPLCLDAAQLEQNLNALKKNSGSVILTTMNIVPPYINVVTPNKLSESKTIQIDPKKAVIYDLQSPIEEDKPEQGKLKQSSSAASLLNGPMTDVPFVDSDNASSSSGSNPPNHIQNIKKSKPNNYSDVKIGRKVTKQGSNNGDKPESEISC